MRKKVINETIGWIGTALIIISYVLVSYNLINPATVMNYLMNIVGAIAIAYVSLKKKDYQPSALNLVWVLIALIGLVRLFI